MPLFATIKRNVGFIFVDFLPKMRKKETYEIMKTTFLNEKLLLQQNIPLCIKSSFKRPNHNS